MTNELHQPVLLRAVLELLEPKPGQTYLDLTAGYGGHAQAISKLTGPSATTVLVDRDHNAIAYLAQHFDSAKIIQQDFAAAAKDLLAAGFSADLILMDLGVSSAQIDTPDRGFSFNHNGPLDMRMDQHQALTAAQIVNHRREHELADILYQFGEERRSRQIARAIVKQRPITDTANLAELVARTLHIHPKSRRTHPATKTFQALRIAVNSELSQLADTLELLPQLLRPGGRVAIISFHSLEDRLVKQYLRAHPNELQILTKKPIMGKIDDVTNPRARSARLRAAIKIKTNPS